MVNPTQFDSSYAYCGQKSGHQLILPAVQREQRAIFLFNYYSIYSFFRQLGVNGGVNYPVGLSMMCYTKEYEVCRAMNITVSTAPMGTNEGSCKGFFLVNARRKIAVINSDLPAHIQRIILPHELGHGVLHWSPSLCTFHETSILNETNRIEYEANIFAAEFMMSDDDDFVETTESRVFKITKTAV